jgi:hypothetical protein
MPCCWRALKANTNMSVCFRWRGGVYKPSTSRSSHFFITLTSLYHKINKRRHHERRSSLNQSHSVVMCLRAKLCKIELRKIDNFKILFHEKALRNGKENGPCLLFGAESASANHACWRISISSSRCSPSFITHPLLSISKRISQTSYNWLSSPKSQHSQNYIIGGRSSAFTSLQNGVLPRNVKSV